MIYAIDINAESQAPPQGQPAITVESNWLVRLLREAESEEFLNAIRERRACHANSSD